MENEFEKGRTKSYGRMRSLTDFTMGLLYLAAAFFIFFAEKLGFSLQNFDKTFRYIFGAILTVYGAWRIYRGYRKDYF